MAEFSLWTRVAATLLLVAISLAAWKWLQGAGSSAARTASGGRASAPKSKKKPKKRAAKKAATAGAQDSAADAKATPASPTDTAAASASATGSADAAAAASESEDESDEDEGLSAVQILAKRKFKVKALGGKAVAAAIAAQQAKLPKYEAGQQVLARFQGGKEWFPATIAEVRRGGEYNLKYDDGEVEYHVSHKLIKPRPASAPLSPRLSSDPATTANPSRQSDASASVSATVPAGALSSSDEEDESDEDDGWAIVGASGNKSKAKRSSGGASATAVASPRAGDGLTKRQRESRRKKERQREIKELARSQAQENGLHAKWGGTYSKMKYVPPPTQS